MDFDNPYDVLNYDNKLLNELLETPYSNPSYKPTNSSSIDYRLDHIIREQENIKKQINEELKNKIKLENEVKPVPLQTTVIREGCISNGDGLEEDYLENSIKKVFSRKVLLMLCFLLFIICVVQYSNQQIMMNDMNKMILSMHAMVKNPNAVAQSVTM